ncbi:hypothetical protein [Tahibacter aquaticus]|uniref:hypothetical protein n=1 Tax=Tahibacter aquaticus TaxID=520092 RepID=UPI00105F405F|nr:hypothetical protein [Tahibacter aquaticus]
MRNLLRADAAKRAERVSAGAGPKASTPYANNYRVYAPSCLHYPMPGLPAANDPTPVYSSRVLLAQYPPNSLGQYGTEYVTLRVWRIPCSSSGQFYDSATVIALDRDANMEGNTARYPLFPGARITQGNSAPRLLVRVTDEPNTFVSTIFADEPLYYSGTFVLENFPTTSSDTARWDFNNQFTLTLLNFFAGDNGLSLTIPAYNPTEATFPDAFRGLPISGYLTGNWFDEAHSGEGMLVQTFEIPDNKLLFTFAWFTYDSNGVPFWLFGSTAVDRGTRGRISVPTIFNSGGGFAGNFGASAQTNTWGTVEFTFNNCYEMKFRYNSTHNTNGVPRGTGEKVWTRTVDTNGLTCE